MVAADRFIRNTNVTLRVPPDTELVKMEPALAGRLSATGLGESKLLSTSNNHEAHQINRRLEVVIDAAR